jgi:RimJ/RimL family protein N-acetyltransferase
MIEIETERLVLREVAPQQAERLLHGERPPGLTLAEGYPAEFTREAMDLLVGARKTPGVTGLFIVRRSDDAVIGDIGGVLEGGDSMTVGYDVASSAEGQGFATEALRGFIGYLFTLPHVQRVQADTIKTHVASRRVMEKAGMTFVREGTGEEGGVQVELVGYEILRPQEPIR